MSEMQSNDLKEPSRGMIEPTRAQLANAVMQAYIELGDVIRLAALPRWFTAELNITQLKAILLLEYHNTLTVSELARLVSVGNPAGSILVQQLVEQGFVERSEDARDRRRTFVRLTEQGNGLIASRREQIRTHLGRWLASMDDADLASLHRGLGALMRVMEAEKERESQVVRASG